MKIKGYIFDFGGTIDTAGCHWGRKMWQAYQEQKVPVTEEMFREAYVYAERTMGKKPIIMPDYTFYETLEQKLWLQFMYLNEQGVLVNSNFVLASLRSAVLQQLYDEVKTIIAKSKEVLLKLKEKYPLVLVSNFYGNMNVVLEEFELNELFDKVIESAVVKVRKPDPQIFVLGVQALGMKANEVAVVGDSYDKDIVPAHSIGCNTIWLKGKGWTNEEPTTCVADKVIKLLTELT
ncbi:HAD family hydrolase [Prevotella ihumii]|uniref:HAD family hydrolase n=1 Tax=Prevotella ihumii TaxID=1917878 RepID=UPI0009820B22|nr:HAD family hydrolase [Prevotella ihumii]